jgi:ketosteroid isomerase-like protein
MAAPPPPAIGHTAPELLVGSVRRRDSAGMYRAVVRLQVRRAFRHLSAGRLDPFLAVFTADSIVRFAGDHDLGGEAHGVEAVRSLFERLLRLFPGLQVEPLAVVVNGMPWRTTVASRLRVRAELPDGSAYGNEGMQYLVLRWGKVVEDRIYEDTVALERALGVIAGSPAGETAGGIVG